MSSALPAGARRVSPCASRKPFRTKATMETSTGPPTALFGMEINDNKLISARNILTPLRNLTTAAISPLPLRLAAEVEQLASASHAAAPRKCHRHRRRQNSQRGAYVFTSNSSYRYWTPVASCLAGASDRPLPRRQGRPRHEQQDPACPLLPARRLRVHPVAEKTKNAAPPTTSLCRRQPATKLSAPDFPIFFHFCECSGYSG